jgi:hypothetical protein
MRESISVLSDYTREVCIQYFKPLNQNVPRRTTMVSMTKCIGNFPGGAMVLCNGRRHRQLRPGAPPARRRCL